MEKTKVLVIDDSALIRSLLSKIVDAQNDMVTVGAAPDPLVARDMIKALDPDVLTLDIEMPKMDGLEFLEKLMRLRPMPVVMVSTLTARGAEATMRALELGAVDFVAKPKLDIQKGMAEYAQEITDKIRIAARAKLRIARTHATGAPAVPRDAGHAAPAPGAGCGANLRPLLTGARLSTTEKLILIGASTGGTEAIREVLMGMPPDSPGILITQHMPAGFTKSFAERLNKCCDLAVKEAEDGERVLPGHVYIAPGSHHLLLRKSGANYLTVLSDAPPVNRHRPSVEVLFKCGAEIAGPNLVGVMLTGMGKDGALSGLADRNGAATTPRPAVLGLRDLKAGYSAQTPHEAIAEFSVMSLGRSATDTLERFRAVIAEALAGASTSEAPVAPVVLTYPELVARAGGSSETPTPATADARAATLARLRSLSARARLSRPAVVLHLLPPYYPCAAPRHDGLSRALGRAIAGEPDVAVHDFYPFISDASYVSWRGDATSSLARHMPSLGHEYFLPADEAAALDLEVVNLGPWGRDAHGRFERVDAPYALERLPGLLARVIRAAWEGA